MKTNEQKLLGLLRRAVENGFNITSTQYDSLTYDVVGNTLYIRTCKNRSGSIYKQYIELGDTHNLDINSLVTNFEEGEVSFINGLVKAEPHCYKLTFGKQDQYGEYPNVISTTSPTNIDINMCWSSRTTKERLDWLLDTFSHLLNI